MVSNASPTVSFNSVNLEKIKKDSSSNQISKEELLSVRILNVAQSPGRNTKISAVKRKDSPVHEIVTTRIQEQIEHIEKITEHIGKRTEILLFVKNKRKALDEENAVTLFSRLIFLLDRGEFTNLESIEDDFNNHLNQYMRFLDISFKQLTELELRTHLAREFSKILITSVGRINFGIIPSLRSYFHLFEKTENGFSSSFENTLEILYTQPEIREKIQNLRKTKHAPKDVKEVIRASLDKLEGKIDIVDAKRTLLMALLSYPRQEHVGNCFAMSLAISLFSSSMARCIDDFCEIMSFGCLRRHVEGQVTTFPILKKLPLDLVLKPLHGNYQHHSTLEKLRKYLNIDKWPDNAKTIDELLQMAEKLVPGSLSKGRFYIESQTKNPLVGIWSNILASMAEGGSNTLLKTALVSSVLKIAEEVNNNAEILKELQESILSRIHMHYDPEIIAEGEMNGGFVLYDKKHKFKRIDTPTRFHRFLIRSINNPRLKEEFRKKKVMLDLLQVYHPDNKVNDRSFGKINDLAYTPWINKIGNDPKQLLKIYRGVSQTDLWHTVHPKDAMDLLKQVILTSRQFFKESKIRRRSSSFLVPVRIIGKHTFNLIVNHPSLTRWLIEDSKMLETLLAPAKEISQSPFQSEAILKYLKDKYDYTLANPPKNLGELRNKLVDTFEEDFIDRLLFSYIPSKDRKKLEMTAIHFANNNNQQMGRDIHFAFAYNPASLKLEIFETLEEILNKPLDQDSHIKNALWEFYENPEIS